MLDETVPTLTVQVAIIDRGRDVQRFGTTPHLDRDLVMLATVVRTNEVKLAILGHAATPNASKEESEASRTISPT
jgi:hypothetical protein